MDQSTGPSTAGALRLAFATWPHLNDRLMHAVSGLTAEQLALQPSPGQWPLWATLGHLACQRVFWLCDFAGVPGKETTPFTNAAYDCPGDDDLENVLSGEQLASALASTFAVVERALDTWTLESLSEVIRRPDFGPDWVMGRGEVLARVFSHDVWHAGQVSQTLAANGLPRLDVW